MTNIKKAREIAAAHDADVTEVIRAWQAMDETLAYEPAAIGPQGTGQISRTKLAEYVAADLELYEGDEIPEWVFEIAHEVAAAWEEA